MEPAKIEDVQRSSVRGWQYTLNPHVNQIAMISKSSGHFYQPVNVNQTLPPGQDGQSSPTTTWYPGNQYQNSYQCAAPYFGTCYVCVIFGHLGKNVKIGLIISNVQSYLWGLPSTTVPLLLTLNTHPNISSHVFTPNKPPVLIQKLTADYVLSQNAWDEITTKLNEMARDVGLSHRQSTKHKPLLQVC